MGKLNSFFQLKRAWKVKCIAWKNIYERDFLNNRLEIYPHWVLIFKTYFDNQYRGSVELFNNNDIPFGLKFTKHISARVGGTRILIFQSTFSDVSIYWLLPLAHYWIIWGLSSIFFCYVVMLNSTQDPNRIL